VTAGILAERNILYPFYAFSIVMMVSLIVGVIVGGSRLQGRVPEPTQVAAPAG
jgi:hypothetical protein